VTVAVVSGECSALSRREALNTETGHPDSPPEINKFNKVREGHQMEHKIPQVFRRAKDGAAGHSGSRTVRLPSRPTAPC